MSGRRAAAAVAALLMSLPGVAQAADAIATVVIPSGATGSPPAPPYAAPGSTWTGQLMADVHDRWLGASTTRYYLHRRDRDIGLSLPAGMPARAWLGKHVAVRGFGSDALIDVVAIGPVPLPLPEPDPDPDPAPAPLKCSTVGEQKAAVILMNRPSAPFPLERFPASFWRELFFSPSPRSVNSFLIETSSSQASMSGDVFGPFDFDQDYACEESLDWFNAALDAARAAGVDLSPYTRFVVPFTVAETCSTAALAGMGCSVPSERVPNEYSRMGIFVAPNAAPADWYAGMIAHEFGHNLYLTHSNSADFGSMPLGALDYAGLGWGDSRDGAPGSWALEQEYGDIFSVMGTPWTPRSLSARDELSLRWMPQAAHHEVMSSGDFLIEPYQLADGMRALRILRDAGNSSWLWLEYRQAIGAYDSDIWDVPHTNLFQGAYVRYEDGGAFDSGGVKASLKALHFNPSAVPNDRALAAMTPGQSWSDPYTPLRLEVNRGDSSGLSVSAHFEEPCAALTATYVEPDVVIDVSADETCAWQASTAAGWLTPVDAGDGRGNGTIRYRAQPNTGEPQRRGYITVQRQSIPVVQRGTGIFIQPLPSPHVIARDAALAFAVDFPGGATYAMVDLQIGRCWVRAEHRPPEASRLMLVETRDEIAPGAGGQVENEHCTLRGAGSRVDFSNNRLQAVFDLGLHATYGSSPIAALATDGISAAGPLVAGTWTVELPTHPVPSPPATPAGLAASAAGTYADLSWQAADGAVSYRVYEGTTEVKSAIGGTQARISDLSDGRAYRFTVRAVNAAGLSAASNEVSVTPQAPGPSGGGDDGGSKGGGGALDPRLLLLLLARGRRLAAVTATASDPPPGPSPPAAAARARATTPRGA